MAEQVIVTPDLAAEAPVTINDPATFRTLLLTTLAKSGRVQHPVVTLSRADLGDGDELMIGVRDNGRSGLVGVLYWATYPSRLDAVATSGTNPSPVMYGANELMMPAFTELPIAVVIQAAEHFMATGQLPDNVSWANYRTAMRQQAPHHRAAS